MTRADLQTSFAAGRRDLRVSIIANPKSGQNSRAREPLETAKDVFGSNARIYFWKPGAEIAQTVQQALEDGAELVVAAGGDGTCMAVAQAMLGQPVPMAVLPLGTFNFYARGLGLSEDPTETAQQILDGHAHDISVGSVNGQVFLNNASLGIYPQILRAREAIYRRWGRHRIVAYWSVIRTFLRFQRPMSAKITTEHHVAYHKTPLIFVARSAYQLDRFNLNGAEAIEQDKFAVLIARSKGRMGLFRLAWRMVTRTMAQDRDYDLVTCREITIETKRKRALLAYDGEKQRSLSPFKFHMSKKSLKIILPPQDGAQLQEAAE
ncbi:hypothetical protein BFP70_00960 [Thioclava sp. SK-1]|uniref:diacylglycerol/lipid kinase family protein n=1 Tax=Thioclava sp. SK-1 TaxID=1889770 RepID=UPI00082611AC|nr:diacylglycerol kinase family protein [Thioclava sp. SK-1]OCX66758.1 hypothetical protein BFP70_00960 [Thioclava sp. SK-1]